MNSTYSLWSLLPWLLLGGPAALVLLAAWQAFHRQVERMARTLGFGISAFAVLISITSGGLQAWVALPWLSVLVVASLLLRPRESLPLVVSAVLAAFLMAVWHQTAGPLPTYWRFTPPSLDIYFAVLALVTLALVQVAITTTVERRVAAAQRVAERARIQAEISEHAERLHQTFGALPVAVALYDAQTILRYANRVYLDILGKEAQQCLGKPLADLWPRRTASLSAPYFLQAAEGTPARYDMSFVGNDSMRRDFDVFVAPMSPDGSDQFDTLVLMLDRTDNLRMERELAERETMYGAVVDHAPIGILTQVDGLISYANPAALSMLAATWSGRAVGRPFSEFIVAEDREAVHTRIAALAGAPGYAEFRQYCLTTLDGHRRNIELAAISVTRDDKQLVELFCVDVTEKHQADEKIRQLNETLELRVAERTAELEAFTTSVSHDLRAPARQVMSAADIMLRKLDTPQGNIRPMLSALRSTAERMNRTIDALLELSRLGRAGIVPSIWPLGAMVEEIRSELSADLGGRDVSWRIAPLPRVYADPQLLRMVMVNLLGNALKFSRRKPSSIIEVWADELEHMTAIHVRDNGAGFEVSQTDKLFQMFSRLHSTVDFEGTGVGLAHCKRIVERHGGKISASGLPGQGATVRFTLPREDLAA